MSDRTQSAASQQREQAEQRQVAVAIAEREKKVPIKEVTKLSSVFSNDDFLLRLKQAVPKQLSPDRMLRSLLGSVQRSPDLLRCELLDVVGKMLVCASAGLETDTPLGHAHLIPFQNNVWNPKTRQSEKKYVCQVIFGYHGLLDLSYRTGMLGTVNARVVWQKEVETGNFSFEFGTKRHLRHVPLGGQHDLSPEAQAAGTADWPAWVYCHATMKDGFSDPFEVLPWSDVVAIRDRAQAYRAAKAALIKGKEAKDPYVPSKFTEAPWVRHVRPMAAKTAFRQLSNWLPRTIEMATITAMEDAQERGNVDFGPVIDSSDYLGAASDIVSSGDPSATFDMRDTGSTTSSEDPPPNLGDGKTPSEPKKPAAAASTAKAATKAAEKAAPAPTASQGPPDADPPPFGDEPEPEKARYEPIDEFGEVAMENGQPKVFASALPFAHWFASAAGKSQNPGGLRANNLDAIRMAMEAEPASKPLFEETLHRIESQMRYEEEQREIEAAQPMQEASPLFVAVPMLPSGKRNWQAYAEACRESLAAHAGTLALTDEWEAANNPTYADKAAEALITGHLKAHRAKIEEPAVDDPDKEMIWALEQVADMKKLGDRQSLTKWQEGAIIRARIGRFKSDRPDIFAIVQSAFNAKWADAPPNP